MKKDTLKTQSECKNCEGGGIFYWKDVNGVMQKSSCHCGIPPKRVPVEDNLSALNNLGHEKVAEDFSDSPFLNN
jgi:hypothetical protein